MLWPIVQQQLTILSLDSPFSIFMTPGGFEWISQFLYTVLKAYPKKVYMGYQMNDKIKIAAYIFDIVISIMIHMVLHRQ